MLKGIHNYIENNKGVRRIILVWILVLITAVSIKAFWFTAALTMIHATMYTSLLGLFGVAVGFYTYHRGKEDGNRNSTHISE